MCRQWTPSFDLRIKSLDSLLLCIRPIDVVDARVYASAPNIPGL